MPDKLDKLQTDLKVLQDALAQVLRTTGELRHEFVKMNQEVAAATTALKEADDIRQKLASIQGLLK